MVYNADLFNTNPYYDDFNSTKNFLRILFRPGYAVQARELTQLQTILQSQVQSFGDHFFENGTIISGGQISETRVNYARISPTIEKSTDGGTTYTNLSTSTDLSTALTAIRDLEGSWTFGGSTLKLKCLFTIQKDNTNDNYHFMFFEYLTGINQLSDNEKVVFTTSSGVKYRVSVKTNNSSSVSGRYLPNLGKATMVTTQPGIYYVNGFFIVTTAQKTIPYNLSAAGNDTDNGLKVVDGARMFHAPSSRVGFDIQESLVQSESDTTLLDPANGYSNFSAPGADRYKIALSLNHKEYTPTSNSETISDVSDKDFVEILRIENGSVSRKERFPDYAKFEETLARRTYDESGNYVVKPFNIDIRNHISDDSTKLSIAMEPGRAFVRGYEYESLSTQFIDLDKARTSDTYRSTLVKYDLGSYVFVGGTTGTAFYAGATVLNSEDHPTVLFFNSVGVSVGQARFRQLQVQSNPNNRYYFYIYDLNLTGNFEDTTVIKNTYGATIAFIDEDMGMNTSGTRLFNSNPDSLLVRLPVNETIKSVTRVNHEVQLTFTGTVASGEVEFSTPSLSGNPIIFNNALNIAFGQDAFLINLTTNTFIEDYSQITATTPDLSDPGQDNTTLTVAFATTGDATNGDSIALIINTNVVPAASNEFVKRTKTLSTSTTKTSTAIAYDSVLGQTYANLEVADVYSVSAILGSNTGNNYLENFYLDDGQRDTFYDHAKIILKDGYGISAGDTSVDITYRRFTHTGQYGPFTVDSYPVGTLIDGVTFGLENVPSFTSNKTGKTVSLRDVLDYRPIKNASGVIENAFIPTPANFLVDFSYYLPRVDKLVLRDNKTFDVIQGVPALSPTIPPDDLDAMTLYIMKLGSYTFGPNDVEIVKVDNKRYTMRDIGAIEDRLNELDKTVNFSRLEQEANSIMFTDSLGTIIPKTGIVVDDFNGHELGDVTNPDYICSMDFEEGVLRPAFTTSQVELIEKTVSDNIRAFFPKAQTENGIGENESTRNKIYMLDYESIRAIYNILPSTTINVNPTGRIDWFGKLYITPESDDWFSQSTRPEVKLNENGANDAWLFRSAGVSHTKFGFGTQWRDWEINWFGTQKTSQRNQPKSAIINKIFDETWIGASTSLRDAEHEISLIQRAEGQPISLSSRTRNERKNIPDSIINTIDNRDFNNSIQYYARSQAISFHAEGMKPNTNVYIFIDNVQVGTGTTDSLGEITGVISSIPTTLKSGKRLIRIIDSATNNISTATTACEATYDITGYVPSYKDELYSTKNTVITRPSVSDDTFIPSTLSRSRTVGQQPTGIDSLAQNFVVDSSKYPKGFFMESLDLLFASIPTSADSNLPISVEIRPTVNGFPHPSKVVPGSVKTLTPEDDELNDAGTLTNMNNANVRTRFTFDHPIHLNPGEYSIVVRTNSDKYVLKAGRMGDTVIIDPTTTGLGTETVTRQPYIGTLFRPQNAGTLIADNTTSLVFAINRCEFVTGTSSDLVLKNDSNVSTNFDLFRLNASYLDFYSKNNGKSIQFTLESTPASNSFNDPTNTQTIVPNETLKPGTGNNTGKTQKIVGGSETLRLTVTMETDDNTVSPVIDLERLSFTAIQNLVNEASSETSNVSSPDYNGELASQIPASLLTGTNYKASISRYITKPIELGKNLESTDLRVFLKINKPAGTDVQVFARVLNENDDTEFTDKGYIELVEKTIEDGTMPKGYTLITTSDGSSDTVEDEYFDVQYKLPSGSTLGTFTVFAIKIVMHTNDQFNVPKCKDMRVVALV